MKLYELSVNEFLNRVDSEFATPGGGSVSALAIAEGISLLRMCAHLTISKKRFKELCEEVKLDYMARMTTLEEIKISVMEMVELDTLAFNKIMNAYRLSKKTSEEVETRKKEIDKATIEATEVPLQTAKLALKALELSEPTFKYANNSTTSDFGVGVHLIMAGLHGAILNVKTNMHSYIDKEVADKYYFEVEEIELKAKNISSGLIFEVNNKLNNRS